MFEIYHEPESPKDGVCSRYDGAGIANRQGRGWRGVYHMKIHVEPQPSNEGACLRYVMTGIANKGSGGI